MRPIVAFSNDQFGGCGKRGKETRKFAALSQNVWLMWNVAVHTKRHAVTRDMLAT